MAGNTKFMGFGSAGVVQLARWGRKVNVKVGEEAVEALRRAVYEELPKKPVMEPSYTSIYYNPEKGEIVFDVHPSEAELLLKLFTQAAGTDGVFTPAEYTTFATWAGLLASSLAEREAHVDTTNEPGVDGDGLVE